MTRFINEKFIVKGNKFWISSIDDVDCCICPLYSLCIKNWDSFYDDFKCFGRWKIKPF